MRHWLHQFLGHSDPDGSQPLRVQLYRLMCLTTAALCLLVILPANLFQNLPLALHVGVGVLGVSASWFCWASDRGRHYYLGFFAVLVLLLNPIWFFNAGSDGAIAYYYYAALLYPLAILRGRTRWVLAGLLGLNLCGLHVVEYFYPALKVPFQHPSDRLLDLLTGVLCTFLAMAVVVSLILKAYEREQLRLTRFTQELATSEQNYREIFNASSEAIFIRDEAGGLIAVNDRACTLFGCDRAAIFQLSIVDLSLGVSPYSEKEARQKLARALTEGPQTFIWRSRRRNGDLFWSEVSLRAGEIAGQRRLISAVRDISIRMEAEVALRAHEERLRLALEASHQGWFEMNVQTGVGISSDEYVRIIGYDPANFVTTQQGWLEGIHPEDREAASREFRACVAAGDSRTLEYRRLTNAGTWIWIRSIGKIVENDAAGRPLRMLGTHTDITERKELEAQLRHSQRLESVGTLAAGVAHDLNNILTPMLLATSVLEGKLVDGKDRELMGLLEGGAKRGATIVRQLLTFSRDMAQSRGPADAGMLIKEMVAIMRATFSPDIKLVVRLPELLWPVSADPTQLHQVLMNLCINARDAMPAGGILTLSAENLPMGAGGPSRDPFVRDRCRVKITVTDTGNGIAPEVLGRIFDPYFTTKEVGKGTGLGLSTVYGIVKGHHGSVTVDSQPGQGSRFTVLLPAMVTPTGPDSSAAI